MGVSPSSGRAGTVVTITGANIGGLGQATVKFGTFAALGWKTDQAGTQVVVPAPPGPTGTVDVTIQNDDGTNALGASDHFTYSAGLLPTVSSVSPSSGPESGGNIVTITGTNFTGAARVSFGSYLSSLVTFLSSTSLSVVVPPSRGVTGAVPVQVVTDDGSNITSETSTSTGTGNLTLVAIVGAPTFDTTYGHGATPDVFGYYIEQGSGGGDGTFWERGTGHMSNATTLVRDTVLGGSSGAGVHVNFAAGTKTVTDTATGYTYVNTPPVIT